MTGTLEVSLLKKLMAAPTAAIWKKFWSIGGPAAIRLGFRTLEEGIVNLNAECDGENSYLLGLPSLFD